MVRPHEPLKSFWSPLAKRDFENNVSLCQVLLTLPWLAILQGKMTVSPRTTLMSWSWVTNSGSFGPGCESSLPNAAADDDGE